MKRLFTLPTLTVETDGFALPADDTRCLAEVRVQQRLSLPALCELVFYDPPDVPALEGAFALGAALRLTLGGHTTPLFVGEVTAVEYVYEAAHGRAVRVRAYDLLHRLRKRQTVRAHVQFTPFDLASELVADLGLRVEATNTGPLWQRLIQHRQNDLELLVTLAERCGLRLTLREDTLHLLTLEGVGEPVPLALGETLLEARLERNADPATREVSAAGWNPQRVQIHSAHVASARSSRSALADAPPGLVGAPGSHEFVNQVVQDDSHAEAIAQAELDTRVARELTLWGLADGDPRLRPGARVDIAGLGAQFDGVYALTAVTHTIDQRQGFVSELASAPPPPAERPTNPSAALGVVTDINDPENAGRVKVSLPAYADVETAWLSALSVGAGAGKGLMAQPDVGDTVLVLFTADDPNQGVIIGSLYGMGGPPDSGIEGGAVRRYTLLTPGGQRIRLDDSGQVIRLENSDGSFVELSPQKVRIHAARDLEIEAPGRSITIRGSAIDFERG